jgi:hypothetical protein
VSTRDSQPTVSGGLGQPVVEGGDSVGSDMFGGEKNAAIWESQACLGPDLRQPSGRVISEADLTDIEVFHLGPDFVESAMAGWTGEHLGKGDRAGAQGRFGEIQE